MSETTSHMIAAAQACLDGEDFGMSTADLVEDMMNELLRLQRENERLERENRSLEHNYRCHLDAGKTMHTHYHDARDTLREPTEVWASHLNMVPNVRSRQRLDEIREKFDLDSDQI